MACDCQGKTHQSSVGGRGDGQSVPRPCEQSLPLSYHPIYCAVQVDHGKRSNGGFRRYQSGDWASRRYLIYVSSKFRSQNGSNVLSGKGKGCLKVAGELAQALKD